MYTPEGSIAKHFSEQLTEAHEALKVLLMDSDLAFDETFLYELENGSMVMFVNTEALSQLNYYWVIGEKIKQVVLNYEIDSMCLINVDGGRWSDFKEFDGMCNILEKCFKDLDLLKDVSLYGNT